METKEREQREKIWTIGEKVIINAPQLYIDVDVEADGIAGYGSLLAIGAQSPHGESFYSEVKPVFDQYIEGNRNFCEQHGLQRDRLLIEAPDYHQVMTQFNNWINNLSTNYKKEPVFAAFNAAFDWGFIDLYFKLSNIKNPFGIAPLDLKSLAMPCAQWNWRETSKGKLPKFILPDGDFTHHALEDAQYQQKIHFGLAGIYEIVI